MAPDAVYQDIPLGQTHRGVAAIAAFVDGMAAGFSSDYRFEPGPVVATDVAYAAEWVMSGTHDRSDGTLPATGKPYRIAGVSVGRLRDGKIAENRDYWDMASFLAQVGLLPQPPG
jgi:steroid delta-isomerase-like uncharacterized protein